jgi:segregation and condensation protein B
LAHFNLEEISDLPGREDLRAAGLLDPRLPKDFEIPEPMITDDVNLDEEDLVSEDENQFFEDFLSES